MILVDSNKYLVLTSNMPSHYPSTFNDIPELIAWDSDADIDDDDTESDYIS